MDEDYAIGISILVLIGSMCVCCSSYFIYVVIKKGSQEALLPEGAKEDLV